GSRRGGLAAELTRSEFWLGVSARPPAAARPGSARTPGNNCRAWHMLCSDAPSVRRVRGAGRCGALALVVVAAVWTARAEEDGPRARDAAEGPGCEASSLPASSVTPRGAVLFVWPALKEPLYGDADAAPWRDALARVRAGRAPDAGPRSEPRSEAALFLAADLTPLRPACGAVRARRGASSRRCSRTRAARFAAAPRSRRLPRRGPPTRPRRPRMRIAASPAPARSCGRSPASRSTTPRRWRSPATWTGHAACSRMPGTCRARRTARRGCAPPPGAWPRTPPAPARRP